MILLIFVLFYWKHRIYLMNRDFSEINNSLSEEIFEEAKIQFENNNQNINLDDLPLTMLPQLLENLKISIPDSMMRDYLKSLE